MHTDDRSVWVNRFGMIHSRTWWVQYLVTAAAMFPLLGLLFAAGHEHDQFQVDDGDCAVCYLQQAKWLPEVGTPKLAPDSAPGARDVAACECPALDHRYLLEPLRGPPTLA